ncbi:mannosyl oligosaccharide glucosidase [Dictyocaulus viviparus]|uniref:Mannosyl-oligosaccharide glucosidase n=1 Tax=Dictyocaulus viviparus TaxID=29172 RepID=A0A0D8Y9P6_DICVI|nr:mannosyl oligosaccharide glucosidase [Dictyocaulus viviparus]
MTEKQRPKPVKFKSVTQPRPKQISKKKKWGSYRSHTYFGLRTRDPRSPLFGMMWYEQPEVLRRPHMKHWCDQGDNLNYGWYSADGRSFGRQNITEQVGSISVDWINSGEGWSARLLVAPRTRYAVVFYLMAQDSRAIFRVGHRLREIINGQTELLGDIRLAINIRNEDNVSFSSLVWDDEVHLDHLDELLLMNTVSAVTGERFQHELSRRVLDFDNHFEECFRLNNKNYSATELQMAKVALSNMLGGIGYWYGYNRVYRNGASSTISYGPHELFSAVPSRSYFPRGFLWDEGFHNLLIHKFDPELSLEILVSWFNTMSEDGWIPREMILGIEAEAKFIEKHGAIMAGIYRRLEVWYHWLLKTQAGEEKGTFRWRGRNATTNEELNPKTLASGLDDYPRASHPSQNEYHLDLRCWLAFSSRVMNQLAQLYEEEKYRNKYASDVSYLGDFSDLIRLHWDKNKKEGLTYFSFTSLAFFDYGRHSNSVRLVKKLREGSRGQFYFERSTLSEPRLGFVDDVFGYNSLFPLMLKLLPPESEELGYTLTNLLNPEMLWTPYGLRSVSRSSPYYAARNTEHDPPYWRGYIWVNVNYMVLSALKHYGSIPGSYQTIAIQAFHELKDNLVNNMAREFNRTGYIWENYDDQSGHGHGSHPFNGWSSLILMIMSDDVNV